MPGEEAILIPLLGFLGQMLTAGSSGGSSFEPSDVFSRSGIKLPGMGGDEQWLADLLNQISGQSMQGEMGAMPEYLSYDALASGQLPPEVQQRINQMAFGGLEEASQRAMRPVQEAAMSRGLGLSSWELMNQMQVARPLATEAANRQSMLQLEWMNKLQGLRQQMFANKMAVQQSPALERLLKIRLAQPEATQLQMSRHPGDLPEYAYGGMGTGATGPPQTAYTQSTPSMYDQWKEQQSLSGQYSNQYWDPYTGEWKS